MAAPLKDIERFWSKVNKTENCWEWTGSLQTGGYGVFKVKGKQVYAHRFSFSLTFTEPGELYVLHHCDNPKCVRPDHLFAGTPADNSADCVSKGRAARGSQDGNAKLTEQAVLAIREKYARGGVGQRALAREYGTSQSTIQYALNRRSWKHVHDSNDFSNKDRTLRGSQNGAAKLTEQAVLAIRERYSKGETNRSALAREYRVDYKTIWCILNRQAWKHVP